MSILSSASRLIATVVVMTLMVAQAQAITIGPGTAIPNDELDNSPGRINVDQGSTVLLQPGTYQVTAFNFDAGVTSDVQPFLAVSNGVDSYQVIAAGDSRTVAPGGNQTQLFGLNNIFTLLSAQTVFAGIASTGLNPIFLDNGTAANTDHDASGLDPIVVGGTVDGFSNPNLGRTYAFSIEVALVPEPSTALLGLIGVAAMLRRRRN